MTRAARNAWPSALLVLFVSLAGGCSRDRGGTSPGAPVFLISVDTLRADHLPAYGYRGVATPNVDALARDSILFLNAYTHVPITLPSHTTVLTGKLPADSGVRDNYGYVLPKETPTLASFLRENRYATGAAVSSAVLESETGIDQGFQFYDDEIGAGGERDGAESARRLLAWVEGKEDHFLAFLHVFEPHAPYEPPAPHARAAAHPYDGEIARVDEILGLFLRRLKEWKVYDRSLIVFFSDHGEGLGDHGEAEHSVFLYREAIRVPLMVKRPGSKGAGERREEPVALTDIFPTAAHVAGLRTPPGLAGVSLVAPEGGGAPRQIYSETYYPRLRLGWSDLASLVDARYHYVEAPRPELFDIVTDPGELRNLAAGLPPAFRSMRLALQKIAPPFTLPAVQISDPERAKKLAALGYLSGMSPAAGRRDLPDPKDRIAEFERGPDFGRLLAQGRDDELIAECRRFLASNPATLEVWRLLADALERRGRRSEAIAALERGLRETSETSPPALAARAVERLAHLLVLSGAVERGAEIADPESFLDPEAAIALGVAHAQEGQFPRAVRFFEKALALDPAHPRASLNLGTALLRQGRVGEAIARLEAATRLDPHSARAWMALGTARAQSGDEAGAVTCWAQAVSIDPSEHGALFNLGVAAARAGDLRRARDILSRFVRTAPDSTYAKELVEARRILARAGGV